MAAGIDVARDAFTRRSWREAYNLLSAAEPLTGDDLERLAVAAHLIGLDEESAAAWEQAHHAWLSIGDRDRAVRCAFSLGFGLLLRGEMARAQGWLARAERIVADAPPSCASRGFLLLPTCVQAMERGDGPAARALADEMVEIADRCHDADLMAFGLLCRGETELLVGNVAGGMRTLDEVMVAVTAGEVSPIPAGIVYCAVIEACVLTFDLRRAAEWTGALHAWCSAEPDLVPYRGQCLVHRSQVLQAGGDWEAATAEAERAAQHLARHPAFGTARYQQAELLRLRGQLGAAAAAYRDAAALGREPAPGLALLHLAAGDIPSAVAVVDRTLHAEDGDPRLRPAVLAAAVDVYLAAGDVASARAARDELAAFEAASDAQLLRAVADGATGAVLLAEGDAEAALVALLRASAGWRRLGMPYDTARAEVAIACAYRALQDEDAAKAALASARESFTRLGASIDVARVDALLGERRASGTTPLTDRELEVLRQVTSGRTNREIAAELVVSTHTVARHVQNIFAKLGVTSRAAATAYAYEHDLVRSPS